MRYLVELIQTDPDDSPTPGCGHYAGELSGFATSTEALEAGLRFLGRPAGELGENFGPCCDWQDSETIITSCLVYVMGGDDCAMRDVVGAKLRMT